MRLARGSVVLVDLEPTLGHEQRGVRPCVVVSDPDVQVFDNGGPNNVHLEPTVAAAQACKHLICEKPLGRTADESYEIWKGVAPTGVKAMTAFNYRFYPAIVLAKEMIDAGELGEIYHFRGRYHQEWIMDPQFPKVWRLDKAVAGSGALGDLGAHVIDQSRYLVGDPVAVNGVLRTFIEERPGGTVDVDVRTNTLIIKDINAVIDEAVALVKAIDTQTPQVLIESKIVEANLDFSRELGSVWAFGTQPLNDGFDESSGDRQDLGGNDFRLHDNSLYGFGDGFNNVAVSNPITSVANGLLDIGAFLLDEKLNIELQLRPPRATARAR